MADAYMIWTAVCTNYSGEMWRFSEVRFMVPIIFIIAFKVGLGLGQAINVI
jgi:hypothetical protein